MELSIELLNTIIPIFDKETDEIVSQAFIYTIPFEEGKIKPFLIFGFANLKTDRTYYFRFLLVDGKNYNAEFDYNFCFSQAIESYKIAVFPLARLMNDLNEKNMQLLYKSIDDNVLYKSEIKHRPKYFEEITMIKKQKVFENVEPLMLKKETITPLVDENGILKEFFYVEDSFKNSIGSLVFLFNEGGYTTQKDIVMGTRLLTIGVVEMNDGVFSKILSINSLIDKIKNKYN